MACQMAEQGLLGGEDGSVTGVRSAALLGAEEAAKALRVRRQLWEM